MIEYTVQTHPRARNLKLKILPDASVVVVRPKWGFFLKSIDQFVQENAAWIERNRQKILSQKRVAPQKQNEIMIFGKTYQKIVDFSGQHNIGVRIVGEELHIN